MKLEPTEASLNARPLPTWFDDAKFGIFIHWGMWALPAYAEHQCLVTDVLKNHPKDGAARLPYTEWYWNAIRVPGTKSHEHHNRVYGGAPYQDFKAPFIEGLKHWDPEEWAEQFKNSGAKYVVLVTKHHDGFCLWPSDIENPHEANWCSQRDIVGELAKAVRAQGMKFGVYYSGGFDWTFNDFPLRSFGDALSAIPLGAYPAYAAAQCRELIERYEPSVLWNDIAWPADNKEIFRLFADYYNHVPDGVVNDRWSPTIPLHRLMRNPIARYFTNLYFRRMITSGGSEGFMPPKVAHSDFRTPEFRSFETIQEKKWEATRGLTHGFGYNRADEEQHHLPVKDLLHGFIDGVSKNGNLLLNVGPRGENGSIPSEQAGRLKAMGEWLGRNGDAIYGTRPWLKADAQTDEDVTVRFTQKGDRVFAVLLGTPRGETITLRGTNTLPEEASLLDGSPLEVRRMGPDTKVTLKARLPSDLAHVVVFKAPTGDRRALAQDAASP